MKLEKFHNNYQKLQMPKECKQEVYQNLLIANYKNQKQTRRFIMKAVLITCVMLLIIPQTRSLAIETVEKIWYIASGNTKTKTATYTTFPSELPKEEKSYTNLSELTSIMNKKIYVPQEQMQPYLYEPSVSNNDFACISIRGFSKRAEPISYDDLINNWTMDLTETQLKDIQSLYEKEIADEYYDNSFSYSVTMYGEASHASGNLSAMAGGIQAETYHSVNLGCDIIIEKQLRMDGTLMTYATWVKDDAVYNIIGYINYDQVKQIVEGMILQ